MKVQIEHLIPAVLSILLLVPVSGTAQRGGASGSRGGVGQRPQRQERVRSADRGPGSTPRQRVDNQRDRIQQGVKSGELTKGEAKELRSGVHDIVQEKREMKADDGRITADERQELRQDINESSRKIYQEKHDGDVRGDGTRQPSVTPAQPTAVRPVTAQPVPATVRPVAVSPNTPDRSPSNARERLGNQQDRIQQGVRSGELTRDEAQELRSERQDIIDKKKEMKADDGRITADERKELRHDINEASQNIYEEKHDGETR